MATIQRTSGKKGSQDYSGVSASGGDSVNYVGALYVPADFPLLTAVNVGDSYSVGLNNAVISIVFSAGDAIVTLDTNTYNHLATTDECSISGADQPEYNGTFVYTKLGSNQIKYAVTGTPVSPATGAIRIKWPLLLTDNDVTKTNTGQLFYNGDDPVWNGSSWNLLGPERLLADNGADLEPVSDRGFNIKAGENYQIDDVNISSYTNSTPMPEEVGGYEVGTTFIDKTMPQMFNGLLYPYQYPAFTSFNISGQSVTVEVGAQISGAQTFTWATTDDVNIVANSIDIIDVTGVATLFTGLANDGSEPYTFPSPITLTSPGQYRWRIEGTDTLTNVFTRNFNVNWEWRIYWGTSPNTVLTEAQIEALANNRLDTNVPGTYSFAAGDYKYFAWLSSFVQPATFKDASTGFPVAMESPFIVNVTNANGVATNYSVYRTTNILIGTIDIIVAT